MSDYMFRLESHLSTDQNRVLALVQEAAGTAGVNLFLTGGGMRDMLGGFRVRDLDFSVEGPALKLAKVLQQQGAGILALDENRRTAEMLFENGVTAQLAMSRKERYAKTGGKPQVTAAPIQEDLRGRDFTMNAMALSLNRASRGLLLDPTNGLADLERREIRAAHSYVFYDDPVRLLRLTRLRIRLGFAVEERTRTQYQNAREAHVEKSIAPLVLKEELMHIAGESSPAEVLRALDHEGLSSLFSPALAGAKLNLQAAERFEKATKLVESANIPFPARFAPFLLALTAKFSPKDKVSFLKSLSLSKAEIEQTRNLEPHAHKLEQALRSARVKKPSQVYQILSDRPIAELLFVLSNSANRSVQERLRNYLQSTCRRCRKSRLPSGRRSTDCLAPPNTAATGTRSWLRISMSAPRRLPCQRWSPSRPWE